MDFFLSDVPNVRRKRNSGIKFVDLARDDELYRFVTFASHARVYVPYTISILISRTQTVRLCFVKRKRTCFRPVLLIFQNRVVLFTQLPSYDAILLWKKTSRPFFFHTIAQFLSILLKWTLGKAGREILIHNKTEIFCLVSLAVVRL